MFVQAYDGRPAIGMFGTVEIGHILVADRGHDSDALRTAMAGRGVWVNIRTMPDRVKTFPFSVRGCRQRNAVERFFNKLKQFPAIATRYDKRDNNFRAAVQITSIRIRLQNHEPVA